jgi:DNA-binding transcriptional regulator GbsR (MarR family)
MRTVQAPVDPVRQSLIEAAGRTSQDLGLGRIVGQVMAAVYLNATPPSLDDISQQLGLSKASVSIATRQLDKLGLIERVWAQGDRRIYYKTTEHIAAALQHSVMEMLRSKLRMAGDVLEQAEKHLDQEVYSNPQDKKFLQEQIQRARGIRNRANKLVNNPIMRLIAR